MLESPPHIPHAFRVTEKRVLGRGLDALMRGQTPPRVPAGMAAGDGQGNSSEIKPGGDTFGRGLETLLAGSRIADAAWRNPGRVSVPLRQSNKIPALYWYVLDVLLLAIAGWLSATWHGALTVERVAVISTTVAFGAWAAILGVRQTINSRLSSLGDEWVMFSSNKGSVKRYLVHCAEPLFVGEIVGGSENEPEVTPLWFAANGDNPARAVEELLAKLRTVPDLQAATPRPASGLRNVLVRV